MSSFAFIDHMHPKPAPLDISDGGSVVVIFFLRWSMIAAQLPGRTDNEIKNYWNTNLKKQLRQQAALAGGDHPALALAGAGSCLAARHTAQWETARLEAEARLSMLSTSAATTSVTASSSSSTAEHGADAPSDVFLRLWNSEVGDTFRRKSAVVREEAAPREGGAPAGGAVPPPPGDDSSAASNVTTAVTADDYQAFLDMAAEEIGFFHGGFSLYPPADGLAQSSLFAEF